MEDAEIMEALYIGLGVFLSFAGVALVLGVVLHFLNGGDRE